MGESVVKGWWKSDDHERGVPGTYGKGYDGVRRGTAPMAGVVGTLPRMVLADSVDVVDVDVIAEVEDIVDKGLASSGSSLSGDGRLLSWLVRLGTLRDDARSVNGRMNSCVPAKQPSAYIARRSF